MHHLMIEAARRVIDLPLSAGRIVARLDPGAAEGGLTFALEAELAFPGRTVPRVESLAVLAAEDKRTVPETRSHAYLTAGRAAHAASRASRAAELYGHALLMRPTPELRRAAKLGELSAAIELERLTHRRFSSRCQPTPCGSSGSSNARTPNDQPRDEVWFADPSSRRGPRDVAALDHVADPVARSSFRNVFGYALAAAGLSDEASRITTEQMEDAERCRLISSSRTR